MGSLLRLSLNTRLFRPGWRVAIAVSGGADSVALLRALLERAAELGVVLSVAHVHHGIRGAEADADEQFVSGLAQSFALPLHLHRCDAPAQARQTRQTLEEAARFLRYEYFRGLIERGEVDAVATAHTLDDQAETVLLRLLRGAWTEGLGGIHPVVQVSGGSILRPLLAARRSQVEAYLQTLEQPWREDLSNADVAYTRNRIRHELLPQLRTYNPQVDSELAAMAAIARDEEAWWQAELKRLLPSLLLPGRPVRGGGRASSTHPDEGSAGVEIERLRALHPALRRRVVRAAAAGLGHTLSFEHTESLLELCGLAEGAGRGNGPSRLDLPGGLRAERSARELRLSRRAEPPQPAEFTLPVPGAVTAFGLRFEALCAGQHPAAVVRTPRPGDRVHLRYSAGPKRLKEVFERLQVPAEERRSWPVVEWQGELVWMQGAEVESGAAREAGLAIATRPEAD